MSILSVSIRSYVLYTRFFISNTFISKTRLKLARNKQMLSNTLWLKCWLEENKMCKKNNKKQSYLFNDIFIINCNENENDNEKNITSIRHKYTLTLTYTKWYNKSKKYHGKMKSTCDKQHLTHYSPVLLFYTPLKHHKTFRGYLKPTPGCNGLSSIRYSIH